jgi:hypothetical protein
VTATEAAQLVWERTGKIIVAVDPDGPSVSLGQITYKFGDTPTRIPLRYVRRASLADWRRQGEILGWRQTISTRGWPLWELEVAD